MSKADRYTLQSMCGAASSLQFTRTMKRRPLSVKKETGVER